MAYDHKFWMTGIVYPHAHRWYDWFRPRFWSYRFECLWSFFTRGYSTWQMVIGVDHAMAEHAGNLILGFADEYKKGEMGTPTCLIPKDKWEDGRNPTEEDWEEARARWIVILEDIGNGMKRQNSDDEWGRVDDSIEREDYLNQLMAINKREEYDRLRVWRDFRTWSPAMWD